MLTRIRTAMDEKDQGFTLIELLVVMIIIGILAAIAIPVFLNQRQRATESGMKSDLRTVANDVETFFVDNQEYPAVLAVTSAAGSVTVAPNPAVTIDGDTTITYALVGVTGFCLEASSIDADVTYAFNSATGGLGARNSVCAP